MSENTPAGTTPPENLPPTAPVAPPPPPPPPAPPAPPVAPPAPPPPAGGYAPPPPAGGYAPPPPAGGYGLPAGGYAPPPAGGYGLPAGGYAPPPPVGAPYTPTGGDIVIDGVKYGWKKFTENVGPYILGGLAWAVVPAVVLTLLYVVLIAAATGGTTTYDQYGNVQLSGAAGFGLSFGTFVFIAIAVVVGVLIQAVYLNASFKVAAGHRLEFGDFFKIPNAGKVIGTALLVGLATGIGFILCFLPGLFVVFFTAFAILFAIERGLGPVDAIKASIELVKANVVTTILLLLAVYVVQAIGSAICGVGAFVALPVAYLATVYVYRRLQNQQVAP